MRLTKTVEDNAYIYIYIYIRGGGGGGGREDERKKGTTGSVLQELIPDLAGDSLA